jgi:protein phosphatase
MSAISSFKYLALAEDGQKFSRSDRFDLAVHSWIGFKRASNQDSSGIAVGRSGELLAAVADGMGGHAGGDLASRTAVEMTFAEFDRETNVSFTSRFTTVADQVLEQLAQIKRESPNMTGLGTTFSGIHIDGSETTIVHIGDSRIYRLRCDGLERLTTDHTLVQQQVDSGWISSDQTFGHRDKHVLLKALTTMERTKPDVLTVTVEAGDRYLLTSDGVHDQIPEDVIAEALSSTNQELVIERLDQLVRDAGAPDNETIVLIDIK